MKKDLNQAMVELLKIITTKVTEKLDDKGIAMVASMLVKNCTKRDFCEDIIPILLLLNKTLPDELEAMVGNLVLEGYAKGEKA